MARRSVFLQSFQTNVSVTNVTHVYNRTVVVNNTRTTSFNGGTAGKARPTVQEEAAAREQHTPASETQAQHERPGQPEPAELRVRRIRTACGEGDRRRATSVDAPQFRHGGGRGISRPCCRREARGPPRQGTTVTQRGIPSVHRPESSSSQNKSASSDSTSPEHGMAGTIRASVQ